MWCATAHIGELFYQNKKNDPQIYMDMDEPLFNLKEHIKLQTDVQTESQILLLANEHLESKVGANSVVKGYPPTVTDEPIFLYSTDNNNVTLPAELEMPKFPIFPISVSVENDASLAKVACSVGHECKRRVETYTRIDSLMKMGVQQFIEMLRVNLCKLME